jgi:hypothetical protein
MDASTIATQLASGMTALAETYTPSIVAMALPQLVALGELVNQQ